MILYSADVLVMCLFFGGCSWISNKTDLVIEKYQNVLKQTSKTLSKKLCPRDRAKDFSKANHLYYSIGLHIVHFSLPDLLFNLFPCLLCPSLSNNYRIKLLFKCYTYYIVIYLRYQCHVECLLPSFRILLLCIQVVEYMRFFLHLLAVIETQSLYRLNTQI